MRIVLDIETVQAPREEWARIAGCLPLVDPDCIENAEDLYTRQEAEERQKNQEQLYEKSSFDGTYSRIVCIAVILFTDSMEAQEAVAWYGSNERDLLQQFWAKVGSIRPGLIITHNGLGFDLPFIKKRSMIHQVKPSLELNLAKFRSEPVYDTMAVWSNWEQRGWVKLDILARALNVETKSGSGEQVAKMWANGQGREIAEYCLRDTYVTYAVYSKMNFRQPLSREVILQKTDLIEVI